MRMSARRRPAGNNPAPIISALDAAERILGSEQLPVAASRSYGAQALPASDGDAAPAHTTRLGSIAEFGPPTSRSGEFWSFTLAAFWMAVLCCAAILALSVLGPRRAIVSPQTQIPSTFTVGSTRQEVRAVQGEPTAVEGSVWHYGASRVYFNGNSVIRWRVAPGDHLKVPPAPPRKK